MARLMAPTQDHARAPIARRAGFTLVELLVVIFIIVLLIGILVPVVGGVQRAARATSTVAMMSDLNNGIGRFQADHRRAPGYFTWRQMGSADNMDRGMTAWENVMLDLMGRNAVGVPNGASVAANVGPTSSTAEQVNVSLVALGTDEGAYWIPDRKNLRELPGTPNSGEQVAESPHAKVGGTGLTSLPDLVDHFDTPILLWVADTTSGAANPRSQTSGANEDRLARGIASFRSNASEGPALFYWASNASLLREPNGQAIDSLIGSDQKPSETADPVTSLAAALASPAYPSNNDPNPNSPNPQYPLRARGTIIIQSAGRDGVYLGREDSGARGRLADTNVIRFRDNFAGIENLATAEPDELDVLGGFDDLFIVGGN